MMRNYCMLVLLLVLVQFVPYQANGKPFLSTANLSTSWTADHNGPHDARYDGDNIFVKAILLRPNPTSMYGPSFACGFYCSGEPSSTCYTFHFAVFIVYVSSGDDIASSSKTIPQVVWSANRNVSVGGGATLNLTADGDLVLGNGSHVVWSTGTSGRSVARLSLEPSGNLRLVDGIGSTVWQSFDQPTDVLLSGQNLSGHQRLLANYSELVMTPIGAYANATAELYSSLWEIMAYINPSPPQMYYRFTKGNTEIKGSRNPCYFRVLNGTVIFVANSTSTGSSEIAPPPPSPLQFLRFDVDGHLRLREWSDATGWAPTADVFNLSDCEYPTVCGSYGICSEGKDVEDRCKCPMAAGNGSNDDYFKPKKNSYGFFCERRTSLYCSDSYCSNSYRHQILSLAGISYLPYIEKAAFQFKNSIMPDGCKAACLDNYSCEAAIFHSDLNSSDPHGSCFLLPRLYSLMTNQPERSHINSTAFIKVQTYRRGSRSRSGLPPEAIALILGLVVGSLSFLILIVLSVVCLLKRKKKKDRDMEDEEANQFYQLPGMPTRFSYQELTIATEDFTKILGKGGFATVFDGTLTDGTKVAVKRLEGVQQRVKEFLAEVQIIGRIHHVNLVGLVGLCTEKSHRMLLSEYMGNGSLDKWIFRGAEEGRVLSWEVRKKIISQVAKGLLYLHDECSPKIIHLDIKPQNILLDDDFNAKVSDFGLSKLMDRDQSCVMTTMRGTPGYLAPEWLLTSKITDKVDVYSFGVLVIEIVCQRRNLQHSQSGDTVYLLKMLNNMAVEGQLNDFVHKYCNDVQKYDREAMEMLKLAAWCLQTDADQRPSMSTVVKVLDETMNLPEIKYNFLSAADRSGPFYSDSSSSAPLMASYLSGPR